MSSIQEFDTTQLTAARAAAWHQSGEAILTLEAARAWIAERGIVLFAPRPAQLPAPAPSLVEATLGAANDAPTAAETAAARSLLARMVADGVALPLNLLGVPGDVADFVVSAQVFSYVFTLRGDKAWKQPPSTSGAISVSTLGLHIYEVLAKAEGGRGAMSAAELASELGREVTETAIQRALSELWSQLRVLPLLDQGSGVTLWELTTRRFTKAIKAGANAGVPTALSALISLYLTQAITATDDEVATFLSPLTARSRVREVLRALTSARQLETVTVDGKTLLHVPGSLPAFAAVEGIEAAEGVEGAEGEVAALPKPKKIGTGRITSFTSETKSPNEFRGKAVKTKSFGARAESVGSRAKPASKFGPRSTEGKPDRERRPFKKDGAGSLKSRSASPTFTKPWDEGKKPRAAKAAAPDSFTKFRKPEKEDREPLGMREQKGLPEEMRTPKKTSFDRAPRPAAKTFDGKTVARKPFGAKPAFGSKPSFGAKPSFDRKPAFGAKPSFGAKKPYAPRTAAPSTAGDGERTTFKPRAYEGVGKTFEKKPYERKPYERKDNASKTSFPGKPAFGAKRAYTPRASEDGERSAFKPRTFDGPSRPFEKKSFDKKPFEKKPYERKPFASKAESGEKRPYTPRTTEGGGERSFSKPAFGAKPFGAKPSFGAKRPFSRPSGSKPFGKRSYTPDATMLPEGAPVERTLAKRPHKPRAADADQRQYNKDPWVPTADSGEGKRPSKSRGGSRSGGGFKKPGSARGFSSRKKPQ